MENVITIPDKLVEKMVDWENPPTVRDLKHDYDESYNTFTEQVRKIDQWLSSYNAELKVKIPKGNSRVQAKLIRKQAEWRYPSLTEPFLSNDTLFEIQPATHMDKEGAYFNKLILNSQFNKDIDRVAFIDNFVRTCVDEGTTIVKVGWETVEEIVEEIEEQTIYATPEEAMMFLQNKVQSGEMSEEEAQTYLQSGKPIIKEKKESIRKKVVEKINRPSLEICDYRDVIIDPSCRGDLSKANFIIHRFTTDMSTLKKDGRYSNLDMIKADEYSPLSDPDYSDNTDTFSFKDKPRKKFICYEYWGYWDINNTGIVEPIIATYVGDIMIRLDKNPYPFNKLPFVVVPYMPVRRSVYGESDSALLEDNQNIISAVFRGMIDLLGKSANGQTGISKDALDAINYEKYKNGQDFKFNPNINPDHAFHMFKYPEIPRSALEIVQMLQMESEALVGKKAFSEGISGTSLGDMLDINTEIPLINGKFKKMGCIEVGDELIGLNGRGTKVKEVFDIAYPERAFDITFGNGAVIKAGVEHKWTIKVEGTERKYREWHTVNTGRLEELIKLAETKPAIRVYIPRVKRVDMNGKIPDIDAYTLGAWLGDGGSWHPTITSEDEGILNNIRKVYDLVEGASQVEGSNAKVYYIVSKNKGSKHERNEKGQFTPDEESFENKLIKFGLHKRYGGEKHIPEVFFNAPYEIKMNLIRGLMDTDGYAHSGAFNIFCQTEGRLKDDFIRLLKSIGITPKISKCLTADESNKRKAKYKSGLDIISRTTAYEIGFTCEDNPFSLERKAKKYKAPKSSNTYRIKSVVEVDKVLMRCLAVDSEDRLFAVGDTMIMTHNSVGGIRSALDASNKREMGILRRLSQGLIEIARMIISMNAVWLSDEEIIRLTDEEFITIPRSSLAGKYDLELSISTPEVDNMQSQKLAFMLQTLGNKVPFSFTKMLLADIARLDKRHKLAKMIEEYEEQPDPMAQKMAELKIALKEAQIRNETAKGAENEVDVHLKSWKAEYEKARARNLEADSDIKDLEFVRKGQGIDHQEQMDKEMLKEENKANIAVLNSMNTNKNDRRTNE